MPFSFYLSLSVTLGFVSRWSLSFPLPLGSGPAHQTNYTLDSEGESPNHHPSPSRFLSDGLGGVYVTYSLSLSRSPSRSLSLSLLFLFTAKLVGGQGWLGDGVGLSFPLGIHAVGWYLLAFISPSRVLSRGGLPLCHLELASIKGGKSRGPPTPNQPYLRQRERETLSCLCWDRREGLNF